MVHEPVFISLTGEDDIKHYMNAYWIEDIIDADNNPVKPMTAIYMMMGGDPPYYVKESAKEIISMIKEEIKQSKKQIHD